MRAVARQREKFTHDLKVRKHRLTADEPEDSGGDDMGPSPQELLAASLASCTAITIEMYAKRKKWNIDGLEVDVDYTPAERGCATQLQARHADARPPLRGPGRELRVIAAKCPVHRTLEGEVLFDERVELV